MVSWAERQGEVASYSYGEGFHPRSSSDHQRNRDLENAIGIIYVPIQGAQSE